jgi:hypothetical protein
MSSQLSQHSWLQNTAMATGKHAFFETVLRNPIFMFRGNRDEMLENPKWKFRKAEIFLHPSKGTLPYEGG